MTEQELLVDCLRRLNREGIACMLTGYSITPSERQLGDAAGVVAVQHAKLDLEYMRRWAHELRVHEQLEHLLAGKIKPKTT